MRRRKRISYEPRPLISLLIGTVISAVIFYALSLVGALILSSTPDPTSLVGVASLVIIIGSALISSFINTRILPGGGRITAILSALAFCLIHLIIGALSAPDGLGVSVFFDYLGYMGAAVLVSLLKKAK